MLICVFISQVLKRVLLGFLMMGILPAALSDMKFALGVTDSIESKLSALIRKDTNDYSAKNKLKLLKVTQVFCRASAGWELAIVVGNLTVVDKVLYAIQPRADLMTLLSEKSSIVARCKSELLALLTAWGGDSAVWELARVAGCNFGSDVARKFARRDILQLSASILDHFEMRLCKPPYTIARLADQEVTPDCKMRLALGLLEVPEHCASLFVRRLQAQCPTAISLLESAPEIFASINAGGELAIDFSERSHGS